MKLLLLKTNCSTIFEAVFKYMFFINIAYTYLNQTYYISRIFFTTFTLFSFDFRASEKKLNPKSFLDDTIIIFFVFYNCSTNSFKLYSLYVKVLVGCVRYFIYTLSALSEECGRSHCLFRANESFTLSIIPLMCHTCVLYDITFYYVHS